MLCVYVCVCAATFVLVHWTKENGTSIVQERDVVTADDATLKVGSACTIRKYPNCPAEIAGIGKHLL